MVTAYWRIGGCVRLLPIKTRYLLTSMLSCLLSRVVEDFYQKHSGSFYWKITNTDLEGKTYIAQYGDNNKLQHRLYIRRVSPRRENPQNIYSTNGPSYTSEIYSLIRQLFLSGCRRMFMSFSVLLPALVRIHFWLPCVLLHPTHVGVHVHLLYGLRSSRSPLSLLWHLSHVTSALFPK